MPIPVRRSEFLIRDLWFALLVRAGAKAGEYISLDFFEDVRAAQPWAAVELVCTADGDSERILETCALEASLDGAEWVSVGSPCSRTVIKPCTYAVFS